MAIKKNNHNNRGAKKRMTHRAPESWLERVQDRERETESMKHRRVEISRYGK